MEENGLKEFIPDTSLIEELEADAQKSIELNGKTSENIGLFLVRQGNQWIEQAKTRPIPQMLFSEFWFEGELCILFADTNLGKSILAVQICNSISKGESIKGFKLQSPKQPILYFDFELSDKQFEGRYSLEYESHYEWDKDFYRAEINPEKADYKEHGFETFEQHLYTSLEQSIIETGAKILIIDNITYLKSETEKAKYALPLMKDLQALKKKYKLSILALAHTPKRDLSKPVTRNDLQGSKMLINFCDSSFAIGESQTDNSLRYLKQIKARNTEIIYDADNVCLCQISKPFNFLQFEFMTFGKEHEHLKQYSEKDNEQLIENVIELKEQGKSLREIGKELGTSHMKVKRILDANN